MFQAKWLTCSGSLLWEYSEHPCLPNTIQRYSQTQVGGKWTCQAKIPGPQEPKKVWFLIQLIHSNDASSGIGAAAQYVSLVSFTWQIPCKSALASFNEASGELPRHISQSYLILLPDILFSEVFHADDVSAKIWWCSGSLTSRIFQAIWLTCSGSLLQ